MNRDQLIEAIGMIEPQKIVNAQAPGKHRSVLRLRRIIALAATLTICFLFSIQVLATGPLYPMAFALSPALTQALKPVKRSCEDNGIRMEVVKAAVYENEMAVYLTLQDLTDQGRIDGSTDLFDSYRINRPFDSTASCCRLSFDETTGIATFLVTISQWGEQKIGGKKITFSLREFLSKKTYFDGELTDIDLAGLKEETETQKIDGLRGGGGIDFKSFYENQHKINYLIPLENGLLKPTDGVTITNAGFIDGKLHVQLHFDDIIHYDNHGYVELIDRDGNIAECHHLSFWDEDHGGAYDELIFEISPDEIENYRMYGHFVTCKNNTKGNWQVTFQI